MSLVDRQPLPHPFTDSGERLDFPVPIEPQHVVEVFVTLSPQTNTSLSPPFPPRQQSADFHLDIVEDLAKDATRVTDSKVIHPPGQRGVDPVGGDQTNNSASLAGAAYVFQFEVSLAPASDTSTAGGVIGATVLVNADSWLPWTAASKVAWLTITGGASGTGNGTVTYDVAANSGSARTGTLTIGSQTFTMAQSALAAQATLTAVSSASTIADNGTATLSSTGGSGTGSVSYSVATGSSNCSISGATLTGMGGQLHSDSHQGG